MKKKTALLLAITLMGTAAICLWNRSSENTPQPPATTTSKQGGSVIRIVSGKLKKAQAASKYQP